MAYRGGFPYGPVGVPGMFNLRREIDRLFEDAFGGQGGSGGQGGTGGRSGQSYTPAVDAREDDREITLHMDLPGVRPDDVDISVENGLLTVRGQRSQQRKEGQEGRYHFVERNYGSFSRSFYLPQGVDESQIRADFEHGELVIHIPKPALPQPRKVQIGSGSHGSVSGGSASGGQSGTQSSGQGSTQSGSHGSGSQGGGSQGGSTSGGTSAGASQPGTGAQQSGTWQQPNATSAGAAGAGAGSTSGGGSASGGQH